MAESLSNTLRGLMAAADAVVLDAPSAETLQKIIDHGEFRPAEDEAMAYWFARFLSVRESLWVVIEDVLDAIDKPVDKLDGERDLRYFLIGYAALCVLIRIDRVMLFDVAAHSLVQRKLNEPFAEYRIPRKQYTTIFSAFVNPGNALSIREAMEFARAKRGEFRRLAGDPHIGFIVEQLPALETSLNPSRRRYLRRAWSYLSHKWRRRGVVTASNLLARILEGLGRTASEFYDATNKRVTSDKLLEIGAFLQPGDIIVTRHAKALTNLFLPGFWPHAALYIGTNAERAERCISVDWAKEQRWCGDRCVLEARKDGVHFRPLHDTLSVDVFAVLRPAISAAGVVTAIQRAVMHEGKMYNFDFDFFNSDRIVCTELMYRAYDGLEDISFPLRERAGRKTLSAEDLLDYALNHDRFEPVAIFGVEGATSQIVYGAASRQLLIDSYR